MKWIKELPVDFKTKESNIDKLNFLFNQEKFYIMDNHLGAAWCWMQKLMPNEDYNFFHIDQHLDLLCNAPKDSYAALKTNPKITLDDFLALEFPSIPERKEKVFIWDNYILQTKQLFPNWFKKNYFSCPKFREDDDMINVQSWPSCYDLPDNIHYWVTDTEEKWIVNLDVDYFFKGAEFKLFTDEYIKSFCQGLSKGLNNIEIVTIAMSPECCGGWDNSIYVTNLIAKELKLDFSL